jgi:hypothetical protein
VHIEVEIRILQMADAQRQSTVKQMKYKMLVLDMDDTLA